MRPEHSGPARNQTTADRRTVRTWSWRLGQAGAAALIVSLVGFASPASAHVTVTPSTTAAGAHAVLQFSVGHGCKDSPTTRITIQVPPQITSVTPTRTALWKVTKRTEKVDPPAVDPHGNKIVERVGSVTFSTDTPLPDGYRDVLEIAVQLPDTTGITLAFPTIQTCTQGESAWTEVPKDGQDVDELALPAPAFIVAEPAEGTRHHDTTGTAPSARAPAVAPAKADNLTLAALVAGVIGSIVGGLALFRQRCRT
ncbi:YcnI family copper-binding membrane protein [Micromonosporaceae bacterium Da 78-11]